VLGCDIAGFKGQFNNSFKFKGLYMNSLLSSSLLRSVELKNKLKSVFKHFK